MSSVRFLPAEHWAAAPALVAWGGSLGTARGGLSADAGRSAALPCAWVTADPATKNVQLLLQWYPWQVTGEPEQSWVEVAEAISLS